MTATVFTHDLVDLEQKEQGLDSAARMEAFLRDVEGRAYRITRITVHDSDEALDIVQDSMIRLVRRYAHKPSEEWAPLFYRILKNRTRDWHRRQAVRRRVFSLFNVNEETGEDLVAAAPSTSDDDPAQQLQTASAMDALEEALEMLPARQREAFVLRNFEGLDVAQTAAAMSCSDGSVKTHYSRAVRRLREILEEHWQ